MGIVLLEARLCMMYHSKGRQVVKPRKLGSALVFGNLAFSVCLAHYLVGGCAISYNCCFLLDLAAMQEKL
jgi:hypothetical protein